MVWVSLDRGNRREPTQFLKNVTNVIKRTLLCLRRVRARRASDYLHKYTLLTYILTGASFVYESEPA